MGRQLYRPGPSRVARCVQAIAVVDGVLEDMEVLLPPGWIYGEALAAVEIHPGDHHMHLLAALVRMPDPEGVDLIALEAGKGEAFELAEDLLPLRRAELLGVVLGEADDGMVVFIFVGALLDQLVGNLHLAAQDLRGNGPFFLRQVRDDAGAATRT